MYFDMTRVYHQPLEIYIVDKSLQQLFPYTLVAPAAEAALYGIPTTIIRGQVTPRRTGTKNPEHCVYELASIFGVSAP
jgi:hypothetical protein